MFQDSHRTIFTFCSLLDLLGVVRISILHIFKSLKTIDTGLQISQASKTSGNLKRSYFELLYKCGEISFQEYASEGISLLVFYMDLVYRLRIVKGAANLIS